ncbi:MAG: hypothetical protein AB1664_15630 [Thermodesulfobacteriota bacterium]
MSISYSINNGYWSQQEDGSVGFVPARLWMVEANLNEVSPILIIAEFHHPVHANWMAAVMKHRLEHGAENVFRAVVESLEADTTKKKGE